MMDVLKKVFKGWAIPGPHVDAQTAQQEFDPETETLDALSGHFKIFQLKEGHRFSTDDLLTAWYGTTWCPSASSVLDLGSGIGSVGMVAAWRLVGAKFVTIEAQSQSVLLAQKSAQYNGLNSRYEIRCGDFRDPKSLLPNEEFDLILGSPPYFPLDAGVHGDHPQKVACRFELRGDINDYCLVAAAHLSSGGVFACIFPDHNRAEQAARNAALSIVRRRPVVFKQGEPPLLSLYIMMKSSDLPESFRAQTWQEPDLVIRTRDGKIHPEYSAVKLSIGFPP